MDKKLLHILQHSLGLDEFGQGRQYRNYFVAGGGDVDLCRRLVLSGYMKEHKSSELTDGDPLFTVTPAGIHAIKMESPEPPKLTRSQKRYRRFLAEDSGLLFSEWLRLEEQNLEQ